MPSKQQKADVALTLISKGLLQLEELDIETMPHRPFIDTVAKMNAQYATLDRMLTHLKSEIKDMGTNTKPTEYIRGNVFKAVLSRFKKSYFDYKKAETLLGKKKFDSCWVKKSEESVRFDIQG